jgi:hypothetical protein
MRKISLILLIFLFFTSCLIDVIDEIQPTYVKAKSIEEQLKGVKLSSYSLLKDTAVFPILGWEAVSVRNLNLDRFKEARNAGLTLSLGGLSNIDSLQKALDLAQEVGMKIFIWTPELRTRTEETVKKFINHPANAGYFLQDEPATNAIPTLRELANKIESIDNSRFCYINLLPNYSFPDQYGAPTYEKYIRRFISEIPMKVLSFDNYPVVGNGNLVRFNWYQNLEIVRTESMRANIPFWAFVLSSAHLDYPVPTLAHLRLQAYSNLAYGAKGIQYFTYRIPNKEHYISAPIDRNGNKTKEYYLLQELNKEIHALSYVFLSSHVTKVCHYGSLPEGTSAFTSYPSYIKSLKIEGGNALISELENLSSKFLMIQNNNLKSEIAVKIEGDTMTKLILKDGKIIPASLIKEEFKLTPGDIVLFMREE